MRYDVMNEHYTEIRLFGKPALFNDMRLDQETVGPMSRFSTS